MSDPTSVKALEAIAQRAQLSWDPEECHRVVVLPKLFAERQRIPEYVAESTLAQLARHIPEKVTPVTYHRCVACDTVTVLDEDQDPWGLCPRCGLVAHKSSAKTAYVVTFDVEIRKAALWQRWRADPVGGLNVVARDPFVRGFTLTGSILMILHLIYVVMSSSP